MFWTALTTTVLICLASFTLSFVALADLLQLSGQPRVLSYLFPVIIDGTILWPTVSILWAAGRDDRATPKDRRFLGAVLALGAGVSIAGNALHAWVSHAPGFSPVLAAVISTLPPIALLAASHGLTILARAPKTAAKTVGEGSPTATPVPVPVPVPVAAPEPVADEPDTNTTHAGPSGEPAVEATPEAPATAPVAPAAHPTVGDEVTSVSEPTRDVEAWTTELAATNDSVRDDEVGNDEDQTPADTTEAAAPEASNVVGTALSREPIAVDLSTATPEQLRDYALRRHAIGVKAKDIADEVGRNLSTIYRWIGDASKTANSLQPTR